MGHIAAVYLAVALLVPTQMIVSTKPDNQIIMLRNYDDLWHCRTDMMVLAELADILDRPVWVTCTPMGME